MFLKEHSAMWKRTCVKDRKHMIKSVTISVIVFGTCNKFAIVIGYNFCMVS